MPSRGDLVSALALRALDSGVNLSLAEILKMIREVNPTARGLSRAQEQQRYGIKSRLQSQLIRVHADKLMVIEHEPDTVILRVRTTGEQACHARIDSLEDEARSWVRRQLDLAPDEPGDGTRDVATILRSRAKPATPAIGRRSEQEPLVLGRQARDVYEYEEARGHFERALLAPHTAADASEELLSLLVDHLAADEEAIAFEASLTGPLRKRPQVRLLVAIAILRSQGTSALGRERAWARLAALEDPRASEVRLDAINAALDAASCDEAAERLAHASNTGTGAWVEARSRLAVIRAQTRAPLEAALLKAAGHESADTLKARAQDLLRQWPESRPARDLLEQIEAKHAKHVMTQEAALADSCEARGETQLALAHLRVAWSQACQETERERLREGLDRIEQKLSVEGAESQASTVIAILPSAAGFAAYLDLPVDVADLVRGRLNLPSLDLLDEVRQGKLSTSHRKAAVDAAVAWDQTLRLDPEEALNLLRAQERLLSATTLGRQRIQQLQQTADLLRRTRFRQRMTEAQNALETLDSDTATASLAQAWKLLVPEEAAAIAILQQQLDTIVVGLRRFKECTRLGAWASARSIAQGLADMAVDSAIRTEWLDRVEQMRLLANAACEYMSDTTIRRLEARRLLPPGAGTLIREGTSEIAFVSRKKNHVLGAIVDTETSQILRAFSLRTLTSTRGFGSFATSEGILVTYPEGCLLLDYHGEPIEAFSFDFPSKSGIRSLQMGSDRWAWLCFDDKLVVGNFRGPGVFGSCTIHGMNCVLPVRGLDQVVCVHPNGLNRELRGADGTLLMPYETQFPTTSLIAAAHPDRNAALVLSWCDPPDDPSQRGLRLNALSPNGEFRTKKLLPGVVGHRYMALCTSRRHRTTFLLTADQKSSSRLLAFVAREDGSLRVAYDVRLPLDARLIEGMTGELVFLCMTSQSGEEVLLELNGSAPPQGI